MVGITSHIIVPAAIIIMVGAFLFYLLEVRSVFLGGSAPVARLAAIAIFAFALGAPRKNFWLFALPGTF